MTDEQAQEILNKMVEEFGDKLPNPEHYPRAFAYYVRLFRYKPLVQPAK
jgi:hypothetical protein